MNSSACSSESGRGGISLTDSSAFGDRMFESFLLLRRVDVEITGACVLSDDHPLVDLGAGSDEELSPLLQVEQRERGRGAASVGDKAPRWPRPQGSVPRFVAVKDVVENAGAARFRQELGTEADEPSRRHQVLHPHPARTVVHHLLQAGLAQCEQLRDHADVLLGSVDRELLDRLLEFPIHFAGDDLRLADRKLETLPTHQLHEHRELQLTPPLHLPRIRPFGGENTQRDVADELSFETLAEHARGQPIAVSTDERRGIDSNGHREARLVDADDGQRARIVRVRKRLTDRHLRESGDCDQFARTRLLGLDPVECLCHVEGRHLGALDPAVGAAPGDLLAVANAPLADAAKSQSSEVGRRVEVRDVRLQRMALLVEGRRDPCEEHIEERAQIVRELIRLEASTTCSRVGVDDRKLDLALVRVEVEEELVHLVHDLDDPRIRSVDLVDDEDQGQPCLERLTQDEARLRQRPLACVHEEQDAVDHRERTLDLSAEVCVARRVDDIDLDLAAADGRVLGEDRDPLLALEVHRVEDALCDVLVLAEGAGLPEHCVDQRRLAVVHVGDDRDVSDVLAERHPTSVPTDGKSAHRGHPAGRGAQHSGGRSRILAPPALRSMRQSKSNVRSLRRLRRQPTRSTIIAAIPGRRWCRCGMGAEAIAPVQLAWRSGRESARRRGRAPADLPGLRRHDGDHRRRRRNNALCLPRVRVLR